MAAVMLAGMVPPIALALATVLRPGLFTVAEHENGKSGWALGASFITEGAIPFAAADPLRVIPAIMARQRRRRRPVDGARRGACAPRTAASSCSSPSSTSCGYFIALVAGVVVGAFAVIGLKSTNKQPVDEIATV